MRTVILSAKEVESIIDVEHYIAVDSVVLSIRTHGGSDGAAEVALLVQNIIELQHNCERLAFEEAL